ncbi:unnamed protein product [Closterium sp. Naga37s-1]|nr:unnamed protein product [Closterium sp. Naga37s-1]
MDGSNAIAITTAGSDSAISKNDASPAASAASAKKPAPKRYVRSQIPREILEDPALLAAMSVLPPNYNLEVTIQFTAAIHAAKASIIIPCQVFPSPHFFASNRPRPDTLPPRRAPSSPAFPLPPGTIYFTTATAVHAARPALSSHFRGITVPQAKPLSGGEVFGSTSPSLSFPFTAAVHAAKAALSGHFRAISVPQAKPLSGGEVLGCTAPSLSPSFKGAAATGGGAGGGAGVTTGGGGSGAGAAAAGASGSGPDALVFVSDGRFHLEAMMIANPTLPAFRYDPYARSLTRERYDHSGMRNARRLAVTRASRVRGKRWGVVQGTLGHQGNPRTVDHCVRRIRAAGGTPVVFLVSELTPEKVAAVGVGSGGMARSGPTDAAGDVAGACAGDMAGPGADVAGTVGDVDRALGELSIGGGSIKQDSIISFDKESGRGTGIDAWVQVACPRLSIDWGEAFTAPMLTPYELEVALGFASPWWGGCFCDSDSNVQGGCNEGDCIERGCGSGATGDGNGSQEDQLQRCKQCGACKGDKRERVYPMDHYARDGGPWNASYMPKRAASTRIDYSKWDHLEASSDQEEEFQEEEDDEEEEEKEKDDEEEELVEYRLGEDLKWEVVGRSRRGKAKAEAVASGTSAIGHTGGLCSSSPTGDGNSPGELRLSAARSSKEEETAVEKGSKKHEEIELKPQAASSSAAAAKPGKAKGEAKRPEEEEGVHRSAGASKRPEEEKGVRLLDRTDMVHYLDVRNGWDLAACEPCFDRVVSRRTKLALGIHSRRDFRSTLRRHVKESISLVPPANQASAAAQKAKARAIEEFSSKVPLPEGALGGGQGVQSSRERYKWKCERAAGVCAEAMVLEWMAEPRVGLMMDLGRIRSRLPGVMRELGAVRQGKEDQLASLLVQVLGVKEAGELKEGFGFFMQNLLSGGVRERGEGERKAGAGAGRGVGEQAGGEGWRMFEEMMGMMRMMGASDAPTAADVMTWMRHVMGVDGEEEGGGTVRKQGEVFCMDAESASKARVEDAAMEEARERLVREKVGREVQVGVGGAIDDTAAASSVVNNTTPLLTDPPAPSLDPVNTNPIVSAMAYRVGCILQWVRIYGSDLISARRCIKNSPHGRILPMRHPLRDLPSLLVRLGAIPKPVPWKHFDSEWEEWPRGEEDTVKLPDDHSVRCFHLGIVEKAGAGDQENRGSSKRGDRGSGTWSGGGSGGKRGKGRGRGSGDKGGGGAHPARAPPPPQNNALPIVRCAADAHFLVEFAGHQVYPPACARCRSCLDQFTYYIPFLTLLANFAYRPATVLLNRFLSVFPPCSPEFAKLVDLLLLEPFPRGTCAAFQVHVVRERAEELPVHFLLNVALNWPNAMLQVEEIGMVGRDEWKGELLGGADGRKAGRRTRGGGGGGRGEEGGEEEDDGEVWEEVKDWGFAVLIAWRTDAMTDLIDDCRRGSSSGGPPRKCSKDVATELCNRCLESRAVQAPGVPKSVCAVLQGAAWWKAVG